MPVSLEDVRRLGNELVDEPVKNVNCLVPLLKCLVSETEEDALLDVIQTLRIFFVDALHSAAARSSATADAASQYQAFVRKKAISYQVKLRGLLHAPTSVKVQLAATVAMLEAVRAESATAFANEAYKPLVAALMTSRHVLSETLSAFIAKCAAYADMRYYALKYVTQLADKLAAQTGQAAPALQEWQAGEAEIVGNLHDLLAALAAAPLEEGTALASWCGGVEAGVVLPAADGREGAQARKKRRRLEGQAPGAAAAPAAAYRAQWASLSLQKQAYSSAWFAFLRVPLPPALLKRVLGVLPTAVMPRLTNPLQLSDFLTHAVDAGGLVGILALNGLFTLVTQYGLEYPQFYARVYSLLQPSVLSARYRLTFLRLVDVFLASTLVPAYTVAAFAKRFARLALSAPPPSAIMCVAFIHNLLRRNPSCMCVLHQPGDAKPGAGEDVYDGAASDPADSRAVESSLWELQALRRHQNASVATFVQHLDKDLSDRRKTSELDVHALLVETYASMITGDLGKRLKRAPAVAFYPAGKAPRDLFDGGMPGWNEQPASQLS